ncbi:hypothetical protein [Leptothrix discophora]|uniref:PsiF repeat-containing protein n=1 Tax=Leptothrix discophora TaxID=89 RepID=A0ABT9G7S3_LEPDI|nr:hypothetical protein [Leptothrix discophora]MDP4302527.1 hypothetical protein [Leptothrix discophora]
MNSTVRHLISLGLLAATAFVAAPALAADAASAPVAAASGVRPQHATARAMQERSAKFSACRKEALDRGLQGEALKQALVGCVN